MHSYYFAFNLNLKIVMKDYGIENKISLCSEYEALSDDV